MWEMSGSDISDNIWTAYETRRRRRKRMGGGGGRRRKRRVGGRGGEEEEEEEEDLPVWTAYKMDEELDNKESSTKKIHNPGQ